MTEPNTTESSRGRPGLALLAILLVCIVAGLAVAFIMKREAAPAAAPRVVEVLDVEATTSKAEAGDAVAQQMLGAAFAAGNGVKQSYREAAKWYQKSAGQGNADAQVALADLHVAGQGVPGDEAEAARLYRMAAEQGNACGQYGLALLYVTGRGVDRDIAEGVKWYRKAAEQGNALAEYNLGMRYLEADGVPQDNVEAYRWLTLASEQQVADATAALKQLKRKMSREEITEAKRRVDGMKASP